MKKAILLFGLLASLVIPSALLAQSGYSQTNLVSNTFRGSHYHRFPSGEPLGNLGPSRPGFLDRQQ